MKEYNLIRLRNRRKQAIDDSANAKKQRIDNNSDATQEEKDVAKAKVDVEVAKAKTTIDQATTNDGVDQTRDLGNNSISVIHLILLKSEEKQLMMQRTA